MVVMDPEARSEPRSKPRQAEAMKRTALLSIVAAAALVALKLGAGMALGSLGLISAGIESTGDVVAAVMTLLAIRVAGRPPDTSVDKACSSIRPRSDFLSLPALK